MVFIVNNVIYFLYMTNTIEILGKIMGTTARVKLIRLFLFHPDTAFTKEELINKTKTQTSIVRTELLLLEKINFITRKNTIRITYRSTKKKITQIKKKATVYELNPQFELIQPLSMLLIESELVNIAELPNRFRGGGKLKLVVVSGVLLRNDDRPIDLLIVGDKLDLSATQKTINIIESEIGKELRYAIFSTDDFLYCIKMYDKLIRDIFEFPHQKLLNQLGNFI